MDGYVEGLNTCLTEVLLTISVITRRLDVLDETANLLTVFCVSCGYSGFLPSSDVLRHL